ncbi:MAG: hypothetical protein UMU75_07215 [Halomonas sp.]|nr:hypothetical protein [Halomonas sp.]
MITLEYTSEQLEELNELEAKYGFPWLIVAGVNPKIAAALTPLQRQHTNRWLHIASQRFGDELRTQLGRMPTVEELAGRLALSIAMQPCSGTDGRTTLIPSATQ